MPKEIFKDIKIYDNKRMKNIYKYINIDDNIYKTSELIT
jgi:hypothetical protein